MLLGELSVFARVLVVWFERRTRQQRIWESNVGEDCLVLRGLPPP
jgi:hypothetical protein